MAVSQVQSCDTVMSSLSMSRKGRSVFNYWRVHDESARLSRAGGTQMVLFPLYWPEHTAGPSPDPRFLVDRMSCWKEELLPNGGYELQFCSDFFLNSEEASCP